MSAALTNAQLNRLARTILKNPSATVRREALLEIRKFDDSRVTKLLETVSQNDRDADVRDLAHNLLRKRQLESLLDTQERTHSTDSTVDVAARAISRQVAPWTCRYCGSENTGSKAQCASCGAENTLPDVSVAAQNKLRVDDLFILHARNRKFITGERTRLASTFGGTGSGCIMLFLIPFLLAGILVTAFAVHEWDRFHVLSTSGIVTQGAYTGRRISDDDDSTTYYVAYQFAHNDRLYAGEHSVDYDLYQRSERGAPVQILYSPQDPTISRVAGTNDANMPLFLTVFALFWNLIVWGMFLGIVYGYLRDQKLAREGTLLPGEILTISGKSDSDGDFQLKVQYGFAPPTSSLDFVTKTEHAQRNDLKRKRLPARGTPVAVLYRNINHYRML